MWSGVGFWREWGTGGGIYLDDSAAVWVAWSPVLSPGIFFPFPRIGPGLTFFYSSHERFLFPSTGCVHLIYLFIA